MKIETRRSIYSTATVCGWILAIFLLPLSVQMIVMHHGYLPSIPSEDEIYANSRGEVLKAPEDAEKRTAFQAEDQRMRERFFMQRTHFAWGVGLLITGLLLTAGCFALASAVKPPAPEVPVGGVPARDVDSVQAVRVTYALTTVGIITLVTVLLVCVPRPEMTVMRHGDGVSGMGDGEKAETQTPPVTGDEPVRADAQENAETEGNPFQDGEGDGNGGEEEIESPPTSVAGMGNVVEAEEENPFHDDGDGNGGEEEIESPPAPVTGNAGGSAAKTPEAGKTDAGQTDGEKAVSVILAAKSVVMPEDTASRQWPRFRGPAGNGVSAFQNVPVEWDDETGKNVLWKVPVPLEGFSSPVVWEKHIFLTGGTPEAREIYCFDADTGALVWTHAVEATEVGAKAAADPDYKVDYTGYAPSTGATDGTRFYAIFTNGDVVAVDFAGKEVWKRGLGVPKNAYGHASSLAVFENLLLVQYDQGGRSANLSKVMALNTETGESVWETARPGIPNSWPTPTVMTLTAEHDGKEITQTQLITAAEPFMTAYDVRTGRPLWKVKCLQADVGPSPIYTALDGGGVQVITANEFPQATGVTPVVVLTDDGAGGVAEAVDITKTHVAWKNDLGLPDTVSPLTVAGKYLILFDKSGTVTCLSLADGEMLWDDYQWMGDLMLTPTASPGLVGETIYLVTDAQEKRDETFSRCYIITFTDSGMEITHQNTLQEGCVTSPAFADGRVYLRGKTHLFALGEKGE